MQRRGSVTSNGSAPERPGLLRRTSSGSMTERTFRDPSPNRPASSHGPYPHDDNPPPVPALPKNILQKPESMSAQQKAARRAASVEPPLRVRSPPPRLQGGRGVSLDRGPGARLNEGIPKTKTTTLNNIGEIERPGSRNSVNFSRPMSPQNSPPISPLAGRRVNSPPPTKSTGINDMINGEADRSLGPIPESGAAPVKKKKKAVMKGPTEGNQTATRTTGDYNQPTTQQVTNQLATSSPDTVIMPSRGNELPRPKKKKAKAGRNPNSQASDQEEGFGNAYPSDTDSVTSERSSTNERSRVYNTRAAGLLMKQPSIVREDREAEEEEDIHPLAPKMNGQKPKDGTVNATTPANTSKVVSKGASHSRAATQTDTPKSTQSSSLDIPGVTRHQSLSPARSTHFSSKPEYETPDGLKHQPPERSASPAKSALKHSPSRGHSPIGPSHATRRAGFAPSEASDTASNMSDEGLKPARSKKKGVRVSFDDDLVTVGRAADPPVNPDSPVIMSPQSKPKGRSWLDLVREKNGEQAVIDTSEDNVIKPTPTLPSFGSIRQDTSDAPATGLKEERPERDQAQNTLRSVDASSDNVVGGIIAQDALSKAKEGSAQVLPEKFNSEPLPPEVTSVEGSGYHSDDEATTLDDQERMENYPSVDAIHGTQATTSSDDVPIQKPLLENSLPKERDLTVPSIALQPATPGLEGGEEQQGWLGMPGGFPDPAGSSEAPQPLPIPSAKAHSSEATPAIKGLGEPEPESAISHHIPGSTMPEAAGDRQQTQVESNSGDESDDTGASIYSDAAEEPDDLDGDGFGSINAIVESPAPSPVVPSAAAAETPPLASPKSRTVKTKTTKPSLLARNESEISEPASDEGWDRAQAYWSGLSQDRKKQLEHAALPGALDERVIPNKTMRGPDSVRKKKKVPKKTSSPDSNNVPLPPWPDKQYRSDLTTKSQPVAPPAKSSLRTPQAKETQAPQMRSSMRDGPRTKSSMSNDSQRISGQTPAPQPRGALQKKPRPTSAVAMVDYNKPPIASTPGHLRASSAGLPSTSLTPVSAQPMKKAPTKKPMLLRNDSDSSSSFKKERSTAPSSGKYTMKRTMRPSSEDSRGPTNRASSMSARTTSPVGSTGRRPFSTVGPGSGGMRMSMRDSVEASKPPARTSLRGSVDSKRAKSPSRFGFGKASKPKAIDSKPSSRFSSRFGDSSDEEDNRPVRNSRFADSSDDEPAEFTPVRGIPRRIDEGDSTDLEDSSVETVPPHSKPEVNDSKPTLETKPEGLALATGSLRVASGDGPATAMGSGLQAKKAAEKDKKKRSFFGGLSSKKRDDPLRVRKADVESPARRDTPLERSKTERMLTTGVPEKDRTLGPRSPTADPVFQAERPGIGSRTASAQNSPKSPKLQRRNTPKRIASATSANNISWPLPQSLGDTKSVPDSRPQTSDGANGGIAAGRPDIGTRRITLQEAPPLTAPLVVGKTEKKKRFGMLRKAFGI